MHGPSGTIRLFKEYQNRLWVWRRATKGELVEEKLGYVGVVVSGKDFDFYSQWAMRLGGCLKEENNMI